MKRGLMKRGGVALIAASVATVLGAPAAAQAAPANDLLNKAQDLGSARTASATGTNVGATKESGEPNHAQNSGGASVWYRWKAPRTGNVAISLCASDFDTLLGVYSGSSMDSASPDPLVEEAWDDNNYFCGGGPQSFISSFSAVANTNYRIAVDGSGGATGQIELELIQAPENDHLADAQSLGSSFSESATGDNRAATAQQGEPLHANESASRSVWYRWTPSTSGTVVIDTCGSDFATLLAVYSRLDGSPTFPLTEEVSNDSACGTRSVVRFDANAGTTYWIAVDGEFLGGQIAFPSEGSIELRLRPPPANDDRAQAELIGSTLPQAISGHNMGATEESGEPDHGGNPGGASVWYSWIAPSSAEVTLDRCGSPSGIIVAAYLVMPSPFGGESLSPVTGDQSPCGFTFQPLKGIKYLIAVDGHNSGSGPEQGEFKLNLRPPPQNDDLANAFDLGNGPQGSANGTTEAASKEKDEPSHGDTPGGPSVWYRWMAPASGPVVLDSCQVPSNSECSTTLAVYTSSSSPPSFPALTKEATRRSCGIACDAPSRLRFTAVADTTYWIVVDGTWDNFGPFTFDIGLAPANDDFAAATDIGQGTTAAATGTNVGATEESGEPKPSGNVGGASVWYRWTAPESGTVTADTCASDFNTVLGVYNGSTLGGLSEVATSDDACGKQSRVTFTVKQGMVYLLLVDSARNSEWVGLDPGVVRLALSHQPPSPDPPPSPRDDPDPPPSDDPDVTAPIQTLAGKKKQKLRKVVVAVTTDEDATLTGRALVKLRKPNGGGRKKLRFKAVTREAKAGEKVKLRFKLRKKALRKAKTAIGSGAKAKAKLAVTAEDAAGNRSRATRVAKLKHRRAR